MISTIRRPEAEAEEGKIEEAFRAQAGGGKQVQNRKQRDNEKRRSEPCRGPATPDPDPEHKSDRQEREGEKKISPGDGREGIGVFHGEVDGEKDDPAVKPYFDLAFAKRPAEEHYDVEKDPDQVNNLAADPSYAEVISRMGSNRMNRLKSAGDPRASGGPVSFDEYPYRARYKLNIPEKSKDGK